MDKEFRLPAEYESLVSPEEAVKFKRRLNPRTQKAKALKLADKEKAKALELAQKLADEEKAIAEAYNSDEYLKLNLAKVDKKLIELIETKSSPVLIQTFYKRLGLLEKDGGDVNINLRLTAEQLIAIEREARGDKGTTIREGKVSRGLPLLPTELCVDTEQEHGDGGEVAELEFPFGDSPGVSDT